ncbi:hypothetical protein C8F01DRAFT_1236954 [Mycena amicta]|nr:hypothetical protein C8F01DRAFT_1236954 [Mycena amicta]
MYILTVYSAFVDWAGRALVSAAGILFLALLYFYDFLLTLPKEWEFYHIFGGRYVLKGSFIILRYIPMLYQSGIVLGMFQDNWNPRNWYYFFTFKLANSCMFPVFFVPVLRAIFDVVATLLLLQWILRRPWQIKRVIRVSKTMRRELEDDFRDLVLIFTIMAMEAVFFQVSFCCYIPQCLLTSTTFAQIPSARNHARNFIAPFVDSLTSMLMTRFLMGLASSWRSAKDDLKQLSVTRSIPMSFHSEDDREATLVDQDAVTEAISQDTASSDFWFSRDFQIEHIAEVDDYAIAWLNFWMAEDGLDQECSPSAA